MWAVADGMGGHAWGELASSMTVQALDALPPAQSLQEAVAQAQAALQEVNRALLAAAAARHVPVIGTTVVLLLACGRAAACVWAGDSRIYLCRGGGLHQLTRDHNQFEALRANGKMSESDALAAPGGSMITRALGAAPVLELEVADLQVSDGDVFLLCSDGLSNAVSGEAMFSALAGGDCVEAAEVLVELALAAGGRDNISAVVVRANDPEADLTLFNPTL